MLAANRTDETALTKSPQWQRRFKWSIHLPAWPCSSKPLLEKKTLGLTSP
jgi:hypothetical protein